MHDSLPFVSVVVPAYAAMEQLPECLSCLVSQTYPAELFEIIVVDNGDNEGLDRLRDNYDNLKIVTEPRHSSYVARNRGIQYAKGEVIVFTDADCEPLPQFINEGVKVLQAYPECGLVGGRVKLRFRKPDSPTLMEQYEHATTFLQEVYISHDHATTSNIFVRKTVLDDVGLFNEDLKSLGDMEWSRRVVGAGYTLAYSDEACVAHPTRKTFRAMAKRSRRMAGGRYDLAKTSGWPLFMFMKDMVRAVLPLRRLVPIIRYQHGSFMLKVKFVGILMGLSYIEAGERIRLQFSGAQSERS